MSLSNPIFFIILSLALMTLTACGGGSNNGENNLTNDTTPPVITLNGSNPLTIVKDSTFTDPGATANDDIDGSLNVNATDDLNVSVAGTYTITYTATDTAGNNATKTRTINVLAIANTASAQITGNLKNARVEIYEIENDGKKTLLATEETDQNGNFDPQASLLDDNKFYIYQAQGGVDTQNSKDNKGTIRAIIKGSIPKSKGFTVSIASEMLYILSAKQVKYNYSIEGLQKAADQRAKAVFLDDINGNNTIDYEDSLAFNFQRDKSKLNQFRYGNNKLNNMIEDIYQNETLLFSTKLLNRIITKIDAFQAFSLSTEDNLIFTYGKGLLKILDISKLGNPVELGSLDIFPDHLLKVADIAVSPDKTKAYITTGKGSDGLKVIDIKDLSKPFLIDSFNTTNSNLLMQSIAVSNDGNTLFVGAQDCTEFDDGDDIFPCYSSAGVLMVFDARDPANIGLITSLIVPRLNNSEITQLRLSEDQNRVIMNGRFIDISNPANPVTTSDFEAYSFNDIEKLSPNKKIAYRTFRDTRDLLVLDNSTNSTPSERPLIAKLHVGSIISDIPLLDFDNDLAYLLGSSPNNLVLIDIRAPATSPYLLSSFSKNKFYNEESKPILLNDETKLYTKHGIFDVRDPLNISVISEFNDPSVGFSHVLSGNSIAISADETKAYRLESNSRFEDKNVLNVYDIVNPERPSSIGTIQIPNGGDIVLSSDGIRAYVSNATKLQVIDISEPANLSIIGSIDNQHFGTPHFSLSRQENTAFLVRNRHFYEIDISNPSSPVLIGSLDLSSFNPNPHDARVILSADEQIAYMAGPIRLITIDISNPGNPTLIKVFNRKSDDFILSKKENMAYSIGHSSLDILDISDPTKIKVKYSFKGIIVELYPRTLLALSDNEDIAFIVSENSIETIDLKIFDPQ